MTPDDFRQLAMSLPETTEQAHMNHPDFRVNGKIFATLGYPGGNWAMVKLPPEQQANFVQAHPASFVPVKGAWGRQGCTNVILEVATKNLVRQALTEAWSNANKPTAKKRKQPKADR